MNASFADLGIEIGKAQAMARATQGALEKVERHLSERIDRLEIKVDKGFGELEEKFDQGIIEIKSLLHEHHTEITSIKIKTSHEEGAAKHKADSKAANIAFYAVVIAMLSVLANLFGQVFVKHL